jgi:hypothetical protein
LRGNAASDYSSRSTGNDLLVKQVPPALEQRATFLSAHLLHSLPVFTDDHSLIAMDKVARVPGFCYDLPIEYKAGDPSRLGPMAKPSGHQEPIAGTKHLSFLNLYLGLARRCK